MPPQENDSQSFSQPIPSFTAYLQTPISQHARAPINPYLFAGLSHIPTQEQNRPKRTSKKKNTDDGNQRERNPNWKIEEDIASCKAWINISEDAEVSTDQQRGKLWDRIREEFIERLGRDSNRPTAGLANRWQDIQQVVNKFSGYARTIERAPTSGFNAEDIMVTLLSSSNVQISSSDPATPTTTPSSTNFSNEEGPSNVGSDGLARPAGRKAAKVAKRKNKSTPLDLFVEEFSNMRKEQSSRYEEIITRKQELEQRKLQAKMEDKNMRIAAMKEQEQKRLDKEIMLVNPDSIATDEAGNYAVSGGLKGIEAVEAKAKSFKAGMTVRLAVAGAFHTGFMEPAVSRLESALASTVIKTPRIPVISNVDAEAHADPAC
ncbi:hypothetical protein CASFOL_009420 [Castilleja foliolosa]|uniref:No apical meristem-associated C-terminal domain-containing protein n=1 Tax=Castilleja foliolosa TaxID=1961234 RepID=A0ABD3DYL9_9LAMI